MKNSLKTYEFEHKIDKSKYIVGCDEVGVGEYFTNLTVCCTLFKIEEIEQELIEQIVDSKILNEIKLSRIANQLKEKIIFEVISLDMDKYNDLINQGYNSHEIKAILYLKILKKLAKNHFSNLEISQVFIDGFVSSEKFFSYLQKIYNQFKTKPWNLKKYPIILAKKADEWLKQAGAASIIAKDHLTSKMLRREKKWKTKLPAGSNQIDKIVNYCILEIQKHGEDFLYNNVKYHFSITQKVLDKLNLKNKE